MFCECGKEVKGVQGLGGHRRVCRLRAAPSPNVAAESRPRARAVQVTQTSSLSSLPSPPRSPILPAPIQSRPSSLDEEERRIRAAELDLRWQRLAAEKAAALNQALEALQAQTARENARAEADRQRRREAEATERAHREVQAESDRRPRIGHHVCFLTAITHWRERVPLAIEDTAKARVREALANAPAGATDAELRRIAEQAAEVVYQHARSVQENAPAKTAAATPAVTSPTASPCQERTAVAPRTDPPARAHSDEGVDGDGDDDECPEGGDVLELEDGEDDGERVGASGLGGLLVIGGLLAAGAWLVKKVTEARGIRVIDPTGQSPAWMRTAPPPSAAPAGYHFETMTTGETVLVRDGYTLA